MADRVVAVIQARVGSSRLPGKSLRPLAGRSLISHVIERVRAVEGLQDAVLATSSTERDDALALEARRCGIAVVRGAELDVLERVLVAARLLRADAVLRATGDCPLFAPDVAAQVLRLYRSTRADVVDWASYASNDTTCSGWPDGTDAEVFARDALEAAAEKATSQADREHVTPYIRRHFRVALHLAPQDWARHKLSVDREEDLAYVARVVERLDPGRLDWAATWAAMCRIRADA